MLSGKSVRDMNDGWKGQKAEKKNERISVLKKRRRQEEPCGAGLIGL